MRSFFTYGVLLAEFVTDDGFTVSSNTDTEEQLRASFPVTEAPETPQVEPEAPEAPEIEPEAPELPKAAESDPERNADGTFKAKGKPRNDPDARVEQAIGRQREAERRAEQLAAELASYRAPKPEAPKAEPAKADVEPQPGEFDTYEKYVKAQARWEARQELRTYREQAEQEQRQQAKQREQTARQQNWQTKLAAARVKHPDFDQRINGNIEMPPPALQAIADSPLGPEVFLYLSDHPEDVQRFSTLQPENFFRELGKLEARLDAASSAPAPAAVSKAPAPIRPVGSSHLASDKAPDPDDLDLDKWMAFHNAKDRERGRR